MNGEHSRTRASECATLTAQAHNLKGLIKMEAALMGGSAALLPGLGLALVFYVNGVLDRREARRDRRHPLAHIRVRTADCPACRGSGWQMYTSRGLVAMQPADVWRVPAVACTECGGRGKLVLAA